MESPGDRGLTDEVTRVQAVTYLQGATGHGVGSLGFLLLGGIGYWATGWAALGFGGLVCAFLLTANGLSIYLWDSIQAYVFSKRPPAEDPAPTRTLSGPSLSTEHRAELIAGLTQVTGLVVALLLVVGVFRRFGVERGSYVLGAGLAVGNLAALLADRLR